MVELRSEAESRSGSKGRDDLDPDTGLKPMKRDGETYFMKKQLPYLVYVLFLIPALAHADSTILLKYKGGKISLEEFLFHVKLSNSPLDQVGITEEYLNQETIPAAKEMADLLSDMVFFRMISKKHRKEIESDPVLSTQVTARVAEYVAGQILENSESQLQVSEKEIRTFYEEHLDEFRIPEQQKVAVLYRASSSDPEYNNQQKALLQDLLKKEDLGENFANYVREYSQAPSAVQGGELDWLQRGKINPVLDEAIFSMKKGDIRGVVETPRGFFLIKSLDYRTTETRSPEDLKPVLVRRILIQKRREFLEQYRSQLAKRFSASHWEGTSLPGPEDVVLTVGQETFTLANLGEAYPQLKGIDDFGQLRHVLSAILLNLLAYRDFQTRENADDIVPQWELEMTRVYWEGIYWLDRQFEKVDRDYEAEAKTYYEEHRGIYHEGVPLDLAVIVFPVPLEQDENLTNVAFDKSRRAAVTLQTEAREQGLEWKAVVERAKSLEYSPVIKSTGMITEYPPGWEADKEFVGLYKGYISNPIRTPEGYAVFSVTAVGEPAPMPYAEALPKAMSVVKFHAFQDMRQRLRNKYLANLNLQFLFPVHSSP